MHYVQLSRLLVQSQPELPPATGLQARHANKSLENRHVAIMTQHEVAQSSLSLCLVAGFVIALGVFFFNLVNGQSPEVRTLPPCVDYRSDDYCLNITWRTQDSGGRIANSFEGTLLAFFVALKVGQYYWQRKGQKDETLALSQCANKLLEHPRSASAALSPAHAAAAFPSLDSLSYQALDAKQLWTCRQKHPELFQQKLDGTAFAPAQQGLFRWLASFDAETSLSPTSQKALQHWCSRNPEMYSLLLHELGNSLEKKQLRFFRDLLAESKLINRITDNSSCKKSQLNAIMEAILQGEELHHAVYEVLYPDQHGKVTLAIEGVEVRVHKPIAQKLTELLQGGCQEEIEALNLQDWEQFIAFLKTNKFEPEQYYCLLKVAYALRLENIFLPEAESESLEDDSLIIEDHAVPSQGRISQAKVDVYLSKYDYHYDNMPSCDARDFISKYQIAKKYDLPKALEICGGRFQQDMAGLQKMTSSGMFFSKLFAYHKMLKDLDPQDTLWLQFIANCEQWLSNNAQTLQALWQMLESSDFPFLKEQIISAAKNKPVLLRGWPTPPEELLYDEAVHRNKIDPKEEKDEEIIELF